MEKRWLRDLRGISLVEMLGKQMESLHRKVSENLPGRMIGISAEKQNRSVDLAIPRNQANSSLEQSRRRHRRKKVCAR